MKRIILSFLLLFSLAATAAAQTAPDAAELTKLLNEFLAGAGRNDPAVHERFWADDLIYTRSAGVRTNKEEILTGLRTTPASKPDDPVTVYTAEDIVIHQYGNTAIVAFRLVSTTTNKDTTKKVGNNLNTGVFMKRNGIWQVIAWQSTIVPESKTGSKPATAASVATAATETPKASDGSRSYLKGSRGGCYYLNASGAKTYVDHKFCN
ncbi:MAG TPA: nuclear transport factor 2 family protein [Pyrinomonadaceae bacterium]|jgi:ketosteroid isomerase-like protein|nr:nuclear transport factor 2 family protein [Pyrinomonadaceae bacterium]